MGGFSLRSVLRFPATPGRRLALVVAAANLLVFALLAVSLQGSHRLYGERAEVTARNTNRLVAQSVAGDIDRIDLGLRAAADEYGRQRRGGHIDPAALNDFLRRQQQRLPMLLAVFVAEPSGQLVYGSEAPFAASVSVADRDYFGALRADPGGGLAISRPVRGRVSSQWVLIFARRLAAPDGSFDGVVFATVTVAWFAQKFAKLEVGRQGTVVMRGDASRDFDLLARVPEAGFVGQTTVSPEFRAMVAANPEGGTYEAYAGADHIQRTFSYQPVGPYPLVTLVGLASDEIFAEWRRDALKLLGLACAFTVMTLLGAAAVMRAWRARAAADDQFRLLLTSAGLGIFGIDTAGLCTFCNPAAAGLLGYQCESELLGRDMCLLTCHVPAGAPASGHACRLLTVVRGGRGMHVEDEEFVRADGTGLPVEYWVHPQESGGRAVGAVVTFADISERRRMQAELRASEGQLQFLAYHDALTGLPNRSLLQERFQQARAYADRLHSAVAVLFLDLDNFKTINDSLGHQLGDALLQAVGRRLLECVRDTDTVSRQGGDEFILLLPGLSGPEAVAPVLVKLMASLLETFRIDGEELTTSASIGIALYPDDGADFASLAKKADMAMYRAKEAGRNTYRFFDEQMTVEAVEHLTMRTGLRRAVENGEFVLHYQPQIDLASGTVVGAEALIRWRHPEFGLVPPGRFIGVAEESRLILPIGEWVLNEACRQAAAWRRAGLPPLVVAVNLSAVQFKRGDIEQAVVGALERSGHDPAGLELEITESVLIQNVEHVLAILTRLKRLGVKLSIDDFGTGYSSLAYLKRFDLDKLKIDQSFVRDLMSDPNDEAIVRAIIHMGRSLNLRTIAEGVESREVLAALQKLECDEAQGYYFARPMPADEFAGYLARCAAGGGPQAAAST